MLLGDVILGKDMGGGGDSGSGGSTKEREFSD